ACPAGALLFCFGTSALDSSELITGCALAFSAGAFLCIALTDLLPEALTHSHDKFKLSSCLLLGTALAAGIELLPGHSHEAPTHHASGESAAEEEHTSHDHHHPHHSAGHSHAHHSHQGTDDDAHSH
ncbi:MAG: hypothetical protein ACYTGL_20625, partial [Planctomycetota bacterium]